MNMDNIVAARIKLIGYAAARTELHDDSILDIAHAHPLDQLRLRRDLLIRIATNSMREAGYIWRSVKSRAPPFSSEKQGNGKNGNETTPAAICEL